MSAAASVQIMMMLATLGGRLAVRGTRHLAFCDARLLGIDKTRVLSNRDSGVSTPHPQGAPCAIHAWRLSLCDTLPLLFPIRLLRPRPAPPQWPAAHSRGSAPHHLINI